MEFERYRQELMDTTAALLAVDSPTGFTHHAIRFIQERVQALGYAVCQTNKGGLVVSVPGQDHTRRVGIAIHVDTLGLMCRAITEKGELMFTKIGAPLLQTLDGEYCRIYTRGGTVYTGTILSLSPSIHVFDDAATRPRDEQNMYVRLDMPVYSRQDVLDLGIEVGDFICIDPKTTVTDSGYLKSRFIDDKGPAAAMLTLLKAMSESDFVPHYDTEICFTIYEEVGHGGSEINPALSELLVLDMGCIGADLRCTEQMVSIGVKDSSGPYDYGMTTRLMTLAKDNGIPYAVDVYPHYGSDAEAAWHAGGHMRAALIGPGVHASHGMERTHWDGIKAMLQLVALYLA